MTTRPAVQKKIVAIVVAAGMGKRFGQKSKPLHLLLDKPLIVWSLQALQDVKEITEIILVAKKGDTETMAALLRQYRIKKVREIVVGGAERQDSVHNGLMKIDSGADAVIIHDSARPLVETALVKRLIEELDGFDGVIAGVPVKDTIKHVRTPRVNEGGQESVIMVQQTLNRAALWASQTPQVFQHSKIREAYQRAVSDNYYATDDAALLEHYGGKIKVVMGSYRNLKITTPEDIIIAEALGKTCG